MKYLILFFLPIFIFGCIEPFEFEANNVDRVIVVDAEISDSEGFQNIKLSYLNAVDEQQFRGVGGATVSLEDDQGNETIFFESEEGIYGSFFGADRDREYRLKIETQSGGIITSDFAGIPPAIEIDSVTSEELRESFVNEDGKNRTINVVKAFGQANISGNSEDLFIRFGNVETVFLFMERKVSTFPAPKTCYVYNKDIVREIGVFEVKANSQDVAVKSLLFTKPIDWELASVFSVKADIISMNRPHFEYWKEIEQVYTQDGNINNSPPAQIRTNLKSEGNLSVIGYFGMISTSTELTFIRGSELTTRINARCGNLGSPIPFPPPPECSQCLFLDGSSTTRPDYW